MVNVLSLGAGVQSSALLLMSCKGILPKLDYAIFADTQWEPPWVYETLEWLKGEGEKHGIEVVTVSAGSILNDLQGGFVSGETRFATIPLHILPATGPHGKLRRQCTRDFKINPIETYIRREILGLAHGERAKQEVQVIQWMGITRDEWHRIKDSQVKWKEHHYPFCNWGAKYLDKEWHRRDVVNWLEEHYPGLEFKRSACIGCPYRSDSEWNDIKQHPKLWEDLCKVDDSIRRGHRLDGDAFLHRSLKPLRDVKLDVDDGSQGHLWGEECEGMCGL